ncbi:hypothetical protein AABB24_039420 [Solanum stoloniferum]|uniref:Thioredoxin-like fold domain-containing protein n=1 Tax=Solanum stoloniferum TaxID=62892 RepID=A0ABD2QSX8_9SOLN
MLYYLADVESITNAWFRVDCMRYIPLGCTPSLCVNGKFYGNATFNLSRSSVVDKIARFTSNSIGNSNYAAVKAGFTDPKTDHATRISFKYGCVKGVYATPFFFVNGFPLPDDGSALDYNAWRKIIHPLLKN